MPMLAYCDWIYLIKETTLFYLIQVALTVLEAHLKVSREMRQGSLLTEGVKQVTSVMYAPSAEQVISSVTF